MMPLGHAEAHERLADLALEPGALDRLGSPGDDPLAAHVVTCDSCRDEIADWKRTHARLDEARGTGASRLDLADLATDDPIAPPPRLRRAILEAVRRLPPEVAVLPAAAEPEVAPVPLAPVRRRIFRGPGIGRLLPLVAVLAIAVIGAGLIVSQASRLDRAQQETAALEAVAATVDRVLRDPNHHVVDLRGQDGVVRGSLSWSSHDLVVLTTALEPPPPDRVYRCWIERDGERSPVGKMWFAGATAFWNGTLDEWATTSFEAGGTFGVSLEPISGSVGNPAVLVAELPG
jgi:hypothetical protein